MEYQKLRNLIDNKIADAIQSKTLWFETLVTQAMRAQTHDGRITKASKNSQQNNSETVTNENDEEIHTERFISLEEGKGLLTILILI